MLIDFTDSVVLLFSGVSRLCAPNKTVISDGLCLSCPDFSTKQCAAGN